MGCDYYIQNELVIEYLNIDGKKKCYLYKSLY